MAIFVIFTYNQLNINTMKNLLLLLALTTASLSNAQTSKLEGSWSSYDNTSYITTISVSEFTGLINRVYSYSSYENDDVTESIIAQNGGVLKTEYSFDDRKWNVSSKFIVVNDTLMKRVMTGSNNTTLIYNKLK